MIKKILNFILELLKSIFSTEDKFNNKSVVTEITYKEKVLMTQCEKKFYNTLKELEGEYIIHPQLCLASVVKKVSTQRFANELFRTIDFAIFDKNYDRLLLLIELNDSSHKQAQRKDRDLKVKKICNDINIKLMTFLTEYPNEKTYVINRIRTVLQQIEKESPLK